MKEKIKNLKERTPENMNTVANNIASLAKGLYDNMFNWLVVKMNQEILPTQMKSQDEGILDLFF